MHSSSSFLRSFPPSQTTTNISLVWAEGKRSVFWWSSNFFGKTFGGALKLFCKTLGGAVKLFMAELITCLHFQTLLMMILPTKDSLHIIEDNSDDDFG